MKVVIPGGTGHIGRILVPALRDRGHGVVVLSRVANASAGVVGWDGRTVGEWAGEIDGADAVINLAGRSVDCRYNKTNLLQMMASRVDSTRAVGEAIERASRPPRVWLQMSTATIYGHRFDAANDEASGLLGGDEPDAPDYWRFSVDIARAWERAQRYAATPETRKVALRTAMVMSAVHGGIFDVLSRLTRLGLGGAIAGGGQFVSWIHGDDFVRAVEFLLEKTELDGAVNLASPNPLPQRDFMAAMRRAWGAPVGLPATKWMVELGAFFLRTDSELILKSRRVIPSRLRDEGFPFEFPTWPNAVTDLVDRWREGAASMARNTGAA